MFVIRIRRSHLRAAIAATMLAAGAFGVGSALATHEVDTIQACVSQNGSLRVVTAASDCRNNERPVEWSTEGAIAIPQACPAGEFVTGINSDGHLICSAAGTAGTTTTTTSGGGGGGGDVCGDGVVGPSEACDEGGNTSACDSDCTVSACGDGFINQEAGEQCDDGNSVGGDGCSSTCTLESSS